MRESNIRLRCDKIGPPARTVSPQERAKAERGWRCPLCGRKIRTHVTEAMHAVMCEERKWREQ